jgi:dolichyl-diphosphooligosaccharide--protein glycosyltransferase
MEANDGADVSERAREFAADRENGAAALEAALAADADGEPWSFDDVALDSGTFGELVSRGIVTKVDGEYRLADPAAVRRALEGDDPDSEESTRDEGGVLAGVDVPGAEQGVDTVRAALVALVSIRTLVIGLALAFVGAVRTVLIYGDVHRDGVVVLPGNDPYRYRYWLEKLVTSDLQPWNPGDLGAMPSEVAGNDVFYYWLAWLASALLGNSVEAVSTVLTWYPVVAAMLTALAVYALTMRLTGDFRMGIASILMLALIPIHTTYTALGFGDHHALDYLLLTLVAGSLVLVVDRDPEVRIGGGVLSSRWVGVIGLGLSLAAQNAAWRGGPLWLAAVGFYVFVQTIADVANDRSPLEFGIPVLSAVGITAAVTLVFWGWFGWLEEYRAVAPVLLFVGSAVVLAGGEGARRVDVSTRGVIAGEVGLSAAVAVIAWVAVPAVSKYVTRLIDYFQRFGSSGITETASLFSADFNVILGPIMYLGGAFVLALPVIGWATWTAFRSDRRGWGVVATLSWFLLVWTAIQLRFAAEFAPFVALFAGIGFVALLSWVDLAAPTTVFAGESDGQSPSGGRNTGQSMSDGGKEDESLSNGVISRSNLPDPSRAAFIILGFLLISSFSLIYAPSYMGDVVSDESTHETAMWLEGYSDENGYEYPENYVFSPWGENLQYNYFVSGESASYGYAQSNYEDFITSSDPDSWYDELRSEGRFVVTHDIDGNYSDSSTQAMLHDRLGSRGNGTSGAGHYRALHISDDRDRAAFELVPGARMTGGGPANKTVTIETPVEIDGEEFTYERQVETNRYGDYGVTVPYADDYETAGETRTVTADDVENGANLGSARAHWTFDEGSGETVRDPVGGEEATVDGAEWVDGVNGSALQFDGNGSTVVQNDRTQGVANGSFSVSFWVKGDLEASGADYPTVLRRGGEGGYGFWARSGSGDFGVRVDDADGTNIRAFGIQNTTFEDWTLITAVIDRDRDEVRLYRNEELMATRDASDLGSVGEQRALSIGGQPSGNFATASVDSVRIYSEALNRETVRQLHEENNTNEPI